MQPAENEECLSLPYRFSQPEPPETRPAAETVKNRKIGKGDQIQSKHHAFESITPQFSMQPAEIEKNEKSINTAGGRNCQKLKNIKK